MYDSDDEINSMKEFSFRITLYGIIILIIIFVYGIIGSIFIMKLGIVDAIYFTFETIATIGYGDIVPVTNLQKTFVTTLAFAGIGTIAVIISTVMRNITLKLNEARSDSIMKRKIDHMNNHYIICGYGRVGSVVLDELMKRNQNVIVIDKDPNVIESLQNNDEISSDENIVILHGDASNPEIMKKFNIEKANGLILTTGSDVHNIYIALSIRDDTEETRIVARASRSSNVHRLYNAGADKVISPEASGGNELFLASVQPYLMRVTTKHNPGDTEKEIDIILGNECTFEDIEYHFPGVEKPFIRKIGVKSKEELLKYSKTNPSALNSLKIMQRLNEGLHSHKISGPDQESLDKTVKELEKEGLLVGVNMSDDDTLKINDEKFSQFIDKHDINIE